MIYLITGGTGTFGRAMVERLLKTDAEEIRVFSRDEAKQHTMKLEIKDDRVKYFIGDVRNRDSLTAAIWNVDYVFHAAAMKHVWSCEQFPWEAILTNVLGTKCVIEACHMANVKKFILLSSDKAVYPSSVMGMTKALAEKLLCLKGSTTLCGVRFGNLINSRGSVIEVWKRQKERGESYTVTDLNATRFISTIEQAVNHVMDIFDTGFNDVVYPLRTEATTVRNLLLAFSNKLYTDVNETGLQPGEKMHEWLDEYTCSDRAAQYTPDELKEMIHGKPREMFNEAKDYL